MPHRKEQPVYTQCFDNLIRTATNCKIIAHTRKYDQVSFNVPQCKQPRYIILLLMCLKCLQGSFFQLLTHGKKDRKTTWTSRNERKKESFPVGTQLLLSLHKLGGLSRHFLTFKFPCRPPLYFSGFKPIIKSINNCAFFPFKSFFSSVYPLQLERRNRYHSCGDSRYRHGDLSVKTDSI